MTERKHSHYFRPFPYDDIDIYRFLEVFEVNCPAAQHIIKKAVATGKRGHKDLQRDWQDIVDSAQRKLEMLEEDRQIHDRCQAHTDSQPFPEIEWVETNSWFDASEKELGEAALAAAQEKPWYPDDIPGLEWKETQWCKPEELTGADEVYVLYRHEREGQYCEKDSGPVIFYDWDNDDTYADIVAYAVKKD